MKSEQQEVPLSPYHQIFYNEQQLASKRSDYNIAFVQRINGCIDINQFKHAIRQFTSNTYLYRCTVNEEHNKCFWVDSGSPPELETFEIYSESSVQAYIEKEFQLTAQPVSRFALFKCNPNEYIFVAVIHHILIDGLKFDRLITTIGDLYNNLIPIDFEPFDIQKQRLIKESSSFNKKNHNKKHLLKEFWEERLDDLPKGERILGDLVSDDIYHVKTLDFSLPKKKYYSWKSSLEHQVSDFAIFLTAFGIIVTKYNQYTEIPISYPIAINKTDDLSLGSTVNTVITRFNIRSEMTFDDLVLRKKKDIKEELEHSALPIYEIAEILHGIKLNISLAQTNLKLAPLKIKGCISTVINQYYYDIAGNDVVLEYDFSDDEKINFRIKYREKYSARFIEEFFHNFRRLLQLCLENPKQAIGNICLLSPEMYEKTVHGFNPPDFIFDSKDTIQKVFENIAASMPNKIACVIRNTRLTYSELNIKANQMANYLLGLSKEQFPTSRVKDFVVGICLERTIDMVIGMLATIKIGSAYLPLDSEYPEERIKLILVDSGCKIVLTSNKSYPILKKLFDNGCIINLDSNDEIYGNSSKNPENITSRHDLGYIIYTSGTTGIPKGVLIEQAGIVRLAQDRGHIQITKQDCFLQASNISFDAATFEIWGALLNGARLHLLEDRAVLGDASLFGNYLKSNKITILWLTVGLFNQLAAQDNTIFSEIKYLIVGGDALSKPIINALVSLPPSLRPKNILNGYGPSENTTFTTLCSINKPIHSLSSIPIGSPLSGTACYILDPNLKPVSIGVVGELYVGGVGLARGYLNRPELTTERFIQNPFLIERKDNEVSCARLYKTGDLVRWLDDGNIEFIGRNDNQIKIRGFRVELQEIEACITKIEVIDQCAVLVFPEVKNELDNLSFEAQEKLDKYIIAYYTLKHEYAIHKQEIKEFLSGHLPAFMMPSYLVQIEKMPLTKNGKIDLKQLPLPFIKDDSRNVIIESLNEYELIIKEIWQEVLGKREISILSNILDIGGHSLHLLRIASKIQKIFEISCSITTLLEVQTIKKLAEYTKLQLQDKENFHVPLQSNKNRNTYPLSFEQKRLWFLSTYTGKNFIYNILTIFKMTGELDVNSLEKSLEFLIYRHQAFQTSFHENHNGIPFQALTKKNDKLACVIHENPIMESDLQEMFHRESLVEFDLRSGELFKFDLYPLKGSNQYIFVSNVHHIISDAWSLKIFFNELSLTYNSIKGGAQHQLPEIDIKYFDYAVWQENILKDKKWISQFNYWKKKLANYENIRLPIKGKRPSEKTYEGLHTKFELNSNVVSDIHRFISQNNCTMHMLLLSVFYQLLRFYSGQSDFLIGIPVSNREHYQFESILGFFVNLLPIRIDGDARTKNSILKRVKLACIEAYSNQSIPYDYLANELQVNRDQSISPLFQVMFNLIHDSDMNLSLNNTVVERIYFDSSVSKFDLTLSICADSKSIVGDFEFNTDLFDASLIQRMTSNYANILECFLRTDDKVLSEIDMLSKCELKKIFYEFNDTKSYYNSVLTVDKFFEARVAEKPNAIAISFNDNCLTYSQLNSQADQLAKYLRIKYFEQSGAEFPPDSLIALFMDRSLGLAIAILAIIKVGCGFVPIDTSYPPERINFIIDDTKSKFVLSNDLYSKKLNEIKNFDISIINIEKDLSCSSCKDSVNLVPLKPNNLAYVIYTSGSTGRPKGVYVTHLGLTNLVTSFSQKIPLGFERKFLSLTSYIFDIFYLEFFGSLCFGAELILTDSKVIKDQTLLAKFINNNEPDIIQATPSLWQLIIDQLAPSKKLNILCGGEPLYSILLDKFFRVTSVVWNLYGPTETTIWSTAKKMTPGEKISIGSPINNTAIFILNKDLQLVPIGVDGEIYIGGDGLAEGYLNNLELTNEKFINMPINLVNELGSHDVSRLYKTGDFGRWLESGQIELLGRVDFQVKIRGHRIELAEIEEQLLTHDDVSQCVVVVNKAVSDESKTLSAYYTSHCSVDPLILKHYLSKKLPNYMIPGLFVLLEKIPLTTNGKIDRNELSKQSVQLKIITDRDLPKTDIEIILADIYCSLLNINEVGINENFFDIGGHSINAIQLLARINKVFDITMSLKSIFNYGKIANLSKHIEMYKNVEIF